MKNGYKINVSNVNEIGERSQFVQQKKIQKIILFVPLANMIYSLTTAYKYYINGSIYTIDAFRTMNLIEKITKEEQQMYENDPSIYTILKIMKMTTPELDAKVSEIESKKKIIKESLNKENNQQISDIANKTNILNNYYNEEKENNSKGPVKKKTMNNKRNF